ncbi:MAG TPA: hypothetical protein VLT88_02915 [Desulfosarcina sp.]|nr:hypothetical protein [Desulfosarcina sp.]
MIDIHNSPIAERIEWLFALADRHGSNRFAAGVLRDEFGALARKMTRRTAILDWRSRRLERIED